MHVSGFNDTEFLMLTFKEICKFYAYHNRM